MPLWDEMAIVGVVARAHGNRGQVIVDPETDFPKERFKPGSVVHALRNGAIEPLTITAVRFHRGRPIVALAGVDTMNAAEALAGAELRVAAAALMTLPPGSFYRHDLVGCSVETPDGVVIGVVDSVDGAGGSSRLVVKRAGGAEVLIPLADEICVGVHLGARKVVVDPPDGLLDLNVTRRQKF